MKYSAIFSHASRLRESGNRFILAELEKVGLSDIAPSRRHSLGLACEACNMSELAKQVHRTKSTVTALVEKLERNGYVLRIPDPEDSRGVLVRLTDKGRALEPAFEAISNGLQRLITDRLSEEETALLDRLLDKCVNG
ncbi:MAG: MarR family winged helix-turn-helix transcriptional regulator [Bilophila wadsworthia]